MRKIFVRTLAVTAVIQFVITRTLAGQAIAAAGQAVKDALK